MGFEPSARAQELIVAVEEFLRTEIEPVEAEAHFTPASSRLR